jgi:hypothetical protein
MKRFFTLLFLGLIGAIVVACTHEDRLRYRVTYTYDTPSGPRSGSHVLETWRAFTGGGVVGGPYGYGLRGEAAVIELADDKPATSEAGDQTVFALLTMGDNGQGVDGPIWLADSVYKAEFTAICAPRVRSHCSALDYASTSFPPRELEREFTPTLITFTDTNNPIMARVVIGPRIDRVAETFGPGFAYRGAIIEIVSSGIWPLNSIRLPFANPVTGTPLTAAVGLNIDDLNDPSRPALRILQAAGLTTASSIDAEYAFQRK